jgi:hypothetical protein
MPTSAPTETFSVVLVNDKHLLITEFDGNVTSAGSMDFQTAPSSVPTGGNAFSVFDAYNAFSWGGVVTSNGTDTITDGEGDDDFEGNPNYDFLMDGGFTAPDALGRGEIIIYDEWWGDYLQFAYYVVGPEAFRLIEIDGYNTDIFFAGSMYGQGTAAGAYSEASLQGPFVFGQAGENDFGLFTYGAAGQFTGDGSSAFTSGVADVNFGDGFPVNAGDIATGSDYWVYPNGYGGISIPGTTTDGLAEFGIYMVDPALNIADPNSTTGGGGALMTDLDVDSLGTGLVVPQDTNPSFSGNYAFIQDGYYENAATWSSFDLLGQMNSDGSSNLSGLVDFNDINNTGQNTSVTISGTFAGDVANPGRSTAQLNVSGSDASPQNITAYQASSDLLLHVDTDSSADGLGTIGFGVLQKQQ